MADSDYWDDAYWEVLSDVVAHKDRARRRRKLAQEEAATVAAAADERGSNSLAATRRAHYCQALQRNSPPCKSALRSSLEHLLCQRAVGTFSSALLGSFLKPLLFRKMQPTRAQCPGAPLLFRGSRYALSDALQDHVGIQGRVAAQPLIFTLTSYVQA